LSFNGTLKSTRINARFPLKLWESKEVIAEYLGGKINFMPSSRKLTDDRQGHTRTKSA
jgi:hypothetical protein